jgi:hypothetical protein
VDLARWPVEHFRKSKFRRSRAQFSSWSYAQASFKSSLALANPKTISLGPGFYL